MAAFGLAAPPAPATTQPAPTAYTPQPVAFAPTAPMSGSLGGVLPFANGAALQQELDAKDKLNAAAFGEQQAQPVITGLAGHIKQFWQIARTAKLEVEQQMLEALRARRGQYSADKLQKIAEDKQPAIYMMVAAGKMRSVEALLRDVLLGAGAEKPWTIRPTSDPQLPPEQVEQIIAGVQQEIEQAQAAGVEVTMENVRERLRMRRDQLDTRLQEEAQVRCSRMERKMEAQLVGGGLIQALDGFVSDLSTFKTAFLKGPVVRNKPQLKWGPTGELDVVTELTMQWERADPFNIYPAPWARTIHDGPLVEKHKLSREDLTELIGVEGYSEEAIREVLKQYGTSGLQDWLTIDSQKAVAEGKSQVAVGMHTGLIDALQYWGSASGQMLIDWGLDKKQVPDVAKEYQIEAWLIGSYVIKAVLNSDPLARRPYYSDSFQRVPGNVWGNAPYDLMKDCQDMCNAAARALAANLGISSGPQVAIISNRLPAGEDVTDMYPWKIWQFETDPMGSTADPIKFFQPQSNATELMAVFDKFSSLADEYVGVPRYMSGFNEGAGGAGRTASGMSMMIGNASKIIKQVLASIDTNVLTKLLERQYYYNMRYSQDNDLKGDVHVVARGAISLTVKEAAQVRRNEFLQATANPIDMQIVGLEGRGEVLREAAKALDMNADKVVPPMAILKERQAQQQAAMAQQQAQAQLQEQQKAAQEQQDAGLKRAQGQTNLALSQQRLRKETLENGAPVSDHFSPSAA